MAVYQPIPDAMAEEPLELPSRTYALDLDEGRVMGYVDNIAAVQQAIRKILISPRFYCLVYGTDYGSEIKDRVTDDDVTPAYINADLESIIEDALLVDDRITGISDFSYTSEDDAFYINFTASTIFGDTNVEEVINV